MGKCMTPETVKDDLIPYDELIELREIGFTSYSPNAELPHSGSVYYYEKGVLYYDGEPMYSSSAHHGQIIAATRTQYFDWLMQQSKKMDADV